MGRCPGASVVLRRWLARLSGDRSGTTAVEFAFGAMVLFGLSMGLIDIGRAMFALNNLEHATKQGVRYAAIHGAQSTDPKTDSEIETFVKGASVGVDPADMTVNVTWEDPINNAPGTNVTIDVTYQFAFMFGAIFPVDPYSLAAQSVYVIAR